MCVNKKTKNRPPRKPREGPYKKVNAYTIKPCLQQILTVIVVLVMIVLHSVFNAGAITFINNEILYVMLILHYVMIVLLMMIYIRITLLDPVDDIITNPTISSAISVEMSMKKPFQSNIFDEDRQEYKYCQICRSNVHFKSYHCNRCNRCTGNFDHHCLYLNSCIGGKNYQLFIGLVMVYMLFVINLIGQNVWLFVAAQYEIFGPVQDLRAYIKSQWVLIGIIAFSVLFFIPTLVLCIFHFYMSCCLDITTLQFIQSETNISNRGSSISPKSTQNNLVSKLNLQSPIIDNTKFNKKTIEERNSSATNLNNQNNQNNQKQGVL